ncbi:PhnD/SsuA/transferrin family substrate-binding protein [Micromonospora sp. WMMD964]|uniref:phosphate/phosphite/phosphonate ABC transporter substrate-binding protein n=1 Tax=Micromonospora sp. WMMD964 TaxID=3016091 RepID=UPI00249CC6A4|nr:PhnD/SsuA/transferrin family substrate-binding protein [Micromonospora sp. WMMD964]WFE98917.1 PhnD/SsuA/transferrin family substrate-binding protein [Micromonospora sp. WMMD964]
MPAPSVLMGAVAYDPKVVTIWEGFRAWLRGRGLGFDFVLYSHYERQVEDLVAGRIDAAWNSPLAWLRAERLALANGTRVRALTMRDTDQDLTSVVVVRADSPVRTVADLAGLTVAVGAVDSPQATLIPLSHLAAAGVAVDVRRFDVGVGLHGDHVGGERDAARALVGGSVDAACMIDANHLAFVQEGTLPPDGTRIVAQTTPYDHCNMTVREPESPGVRLFGTLLLGMSYADPQVRPLLDLEGLTAWKDGRTTGYDSLAAAVDAAGFYSPDGRVTAPDYRP